jgi:hypothetical protein
VFRTIPVSWITLVRAAALGPRDAWQVAAFIALVRAWRWWLSSFVIQKAMRIVSFGWVWGEGGGIGTGEERGRRGYGLSVPR